MKNSILIIFSLLAISCTQITITHDNETRLIEKAIQIDSAKFNFLKDTFNLAEIDNNNLFIGSLKPKYPIALGIKEIVNDNCLFYYGCLFSESVCVIIKECSKYHILNNQEDLKTYFAPINSAEEALSYAYISTGLLPKYEFELKTRYRTFVDTISTTYSIEKKNGYEVNLFDYQLCGCGPHTHLMIKYFVAENGNINKIETVKLYEDPKDDDLCID